MTAFRCASAVLVLLSLGIISPGPQRTAAAQSGGAGTGGTARLVYQQRLASNSRRVLMIGAHPDDEDTELLTLLSRGLGIETAYLSLTRGDGGQNLIGPELGEALGVLRTEELAAARRIDGSRQYFTRAFDFGFSKTPEETFKFWPHDSVLKDMVRIIRKFRPQVVVSVWSGTPADGHGHHQASGLLAPEAVTAAGDPARFPELRREQLDAWQVGKFYRTAGRFNAATPTLTFDGGVIDPSSGLSLHQLAVRSRSQHRSQNQGNLEDLGPSRAGVRLESRAPGITGPDDSLFAGIAVGAADPHNEHGAEAGLIAAGVVLDATTDDDEVTPGQVLPVTLTVWNSGLDSVRIALGMAASAGFTSRGDDCSQGGSQVVAPGAILRCHYTTTVLPDAVPTAPYYLQARRIGGLYQWPAGSAEWWGEPSAPPLSGWFAATPLHAGSATDLPPVRLTREVEDRYRDPVLGEVRRAVMIVPRISVDLEPNARLWPVNVRSREYLVVLEHLSRDSVGATVSLDVPRGWSASKPQLVRFAREGERATLRFMVTAPLHPSLDSYKISARVVSGADTMDTGINRIRYPHVRERNLLTVAQATVVVANVVFPSVGTIGYVRGGGDLVPESMMNAGMAVDLLTGDALEQGSLDPYRVIVIGPRAYEADESLKRAHPRLMKWLEAGGTLIIQYQQTPYVAGGFPPRPFTLVAPTLSRVTDETAPVHFLAPLNPVLNTPNRIGTLDFDGWVQERGLDFPPSWDPAWVPVLETHDSGGPPLPGGLLIARVGTGTAVYTGLAFHRQLPAIVPGAWRLWANILGVGRAGAKR